MAKKAGKHVENARKKVEARPYKLADAAELLQIKLLDHIIIGDHHFSSLKQLGLDYRLAATAAWANVRPGSPAIATGQ